MKIRPRRLGFEKKTCACFQNKCARNSRQNFFAIRFYQGNDLRSMFMTFLFLQNTICLKGFGIHPRVCTKYAHSMQKGCTKCARACSMHTISVVCIFVLHKVCICRHGSYFFSIHVQNICTKLGAVKHQVCT